MRDIEQWKDVKLEGKSFRFDYEVSTLGRIRNKTTGSVISVWCKAHPSRRCFDRLPSVLLKKDECPNMNLTYQLYVPVIMYITFIDPTLKYEDIVQKITVVDQHLYRDLVPLEDIILRKDHISRRNRINDSKRYNEIREIRDRTRELINKYPDKRIIDIYRMINPLGKSIGDNDYCAVQREVYIYRKIKGGNENGK